MKLTPKQQKWRAAAVANPKGFAAKRILIPDLMGKTVPFVYNWAQQQVSDRKKEIHKSGKPLRLWCLKYRRAGISMLETFENWAYMYGTDNARIAILAHLESRAKELLDEYVKPFDSCLTSSFPDIALDKARDNILGLKYAGTNAQILIATAENAVRVRGGGIHRAQLTEAAWYFNLFDKVMEEMGPTIPAAAGTQLVIETTGTLIGSQPHTHFMAAEKKQNEFETMFLCWLDNPALRIPFVSDYERDKLFSHMQDQEPRLLEMARFYKLEPSQIHQMWKFYHLQCRNDFELLCREFPITKEMAWTTGGDSFFGVYEVAKARPEQPEYIYVIEHDHMRRLFRDPSELRRVEAVDDYNNLPNVKIWALPRKGARYIIGQDSSLGESGGDYTSGYVIDLRTREMMAAYHGLMRPDEAACVMVSLARMYNNALAAPETNPAGGGFEALNCLQRLGYHNIYSWRKRDSFRGIESSKSLGWWTTSWSRPLLLGELRKTFIDAVRNRIPDAGQFRDKALISELRTFGVKPDGTPSANAGCFDDRVFAIGIAHQVANDEIYCTTQDPLAVYSRSMMPKPEPQELVMKRTPDQVVNQFMDPRSAFNRNKFEI